MTVDTAKVGEAVALAFDRMIELEAAGAIKSDSKIGAAYLVVALDRPTDDDAEDRHLLSNVMTDIFVFGVPDHVYVQVGLLTMALDNIVE